MRVPVEGPTPGSRYGHTMVYIMPNLFLFGGSVKNEIVNDVWVLSTDKTPFKWEKVSINGTPPLSRVYHTANLFKIPNNFEMMVIFGGRDKEGNSLSDITGVKKREDGGFEWVDFPTNSKNGIIGRHQHSAVFFGPFMFVIGGRLNNPKDPATFEVYSMNKLKWFKFGSISLFRHSAWIFSNITSQDDYEIYMYLYGGFDGDNNSLINPYLYRINIVELFSQEETLRSELSEHISMLLLIQEQKQKAKINKKTEEKKFQLSPGVVVYNVGEEDNFGTIVRIMSLRKFKNIDCKINETEANLNQKHVYDVNLVEEYATLLPLMDNFVPFTLEEFPFKFDINSLSKLIADARSLFESEPSLLRLKCPIKIFGSINGQYNDLIRYFNFWGRPSEHKGDIEIWEYLFIGNIVNRGSFSLETLALLLSLKVNI